MARAQVNWTDAKGKFLKADLQVHECGSQPVSYVRELQAPPEAAVATFYSAGHTADPVEFRQYSLRR
jgi:hypothetical protein